METTQFITRELEDLFSAGPLSDCFVIEVTPKGKNGITVYVDSDSGMTLEKCAKVSRFLENRLDEEGNLGAAYTLDVSSPGLDRPLMFWRQYHRQKGRGLVVTMKDGVRIEGTLEDVGPDSISVQTGKTKTEIPFAEIEKSFVQISF